MPDEIVFAKHETIGANAAEDDTLFLHECFVDTGDLEILRDCSNPKRIVVGRTGAGKSALLAKLCEGQERSIALNVHSLSLSYLANNGVFLFFEELGVNLAPFYGLMWRHILVTALIQLRYEIHSEENQKDFVHAIRNKLGRKNKNKEFAIEYLEKFNGKFWLSTEETTKEVCTSVERELMAEAAIDISQIKMGAKGATHLSEEQKTQMTNRGREIVSHVQIRELDNLISLLDEDIFDDPQKPHYITVDMLDEEWVDIRIRYKLIRALMGVVKKFGNVRNVKIVLAIRQDLFEKVLYSIKETGFQEEKYDSIQFRLRWSRTQLRELVELRIGKLFRRKYRNSSVTLREIMPSSIDGQDPIEW